MRRLLGDLKARRQQLLARSQPAPGHSHSAAAGPVERMDLTSRLERLAALHRQGALTDAEFAEAKRRVIAEVAAGR